MSSERSEEVTGTLYVVGTAHLDTQWRWTVRSTVERFLPRTVQENADRFRRFPSYILNFDGAFRTTLLEEYAPAAFREVQRWVEAGRWHPAGAFFEAADVNVASPEALIRHVLYGNQVYQRAFGRESRDVFLPDCFGFGWALPSVAAHCGLRGFSTSKLVKWYPADRLPFELGIWEGPDGGWVLAALRPEGYGTKIDRDLSRDDEWRRRIEAEGRRSGVYVGLRYFGVGDRGGAPEAGSLRWLERSLEGEGPLAVKSATSEAVFDHLAGEDTTRLPRFRDELLLPTHGTGCWTSQAAMKRWNRQNELLAGTAEAASVIADWLGVQSYPAEALGQAWRRFLWHQHHDDVTGTSVPEAYRYSWNDELICLNQLADVLTQAVGAVSRLLDTSVEGIPLVVFNPLGHARRDLVEVRLEGELAALSGPRVWGPSGDDEVPSQLSGSDDGSRKLVFSARVPAVGFAVYEIRDGAPRPESATERADARVLENEALRVELDEAGDIASLVDRASGRQVLAAPVGLELFADRSPRWPAWEIQYRDLAAPSRSRVGAPARIRTIEQGPVRHVVEVERQREASRFVQRISLGMEGASRRLEISSRLDWRTRGRLLKAVFPLALADPIATYDLGWGAIERGVNTPFRYEVPAQQWADLSAGSGELGVGVATDSRYGWDRPAPHVLRLSLVRSPSVGRRFRHQATQDFGRHRVRIALLPHRGDWAAGGVVPQAQALNQPLRAFRVAKHGGPLGRVFSLLEVDGQDLVLRALKLAEDGRGVVLRLQEAAGRKLRGAAVRFATAVQRATETDGCERRRGELASVEERVELDFGPFQPRTLRVELGRAPVPPAVPRFAALELPFDSDVVSRNGEPIRDGMGRRRWAFPAELLPAGLVCGGVELRLGPRQGGVASAVRCRRQSLRLPAGERWASLQLLAAAGDRDVVGSFGIGARTVEAKVPSSRGWLGQWWARRWRLWPPGRRLAPEFVERTPLAWVGSHRHDGRGRDLACSPCYLFRLRFELAPEDMTLRLPEEPEIRILAATVATPGLGWAAPTDLLYD